MKSQTSQPSVYTRPLEHRFKDITARVAAGENRHKLAVELMLQKRASLKCTTPGTDRQPHFAHIRSYAV